MPKRIIMRIELTEGAKDSLQGFADQAGMTQFAITSRLIEWFSQQPESIQAAIVQRYPNEVSPDVVKLVLKNMINEK